MAEAASCTPSFTLLFLQHLAIQQGQDLPALLEANSVHVIFSYSDGNEMMFPTTVFKKQGSWVHVFSFLFYRCHVEAILGHDVVTSSVPGLHSSSLLKALSEIFLSDERFFEKKHLEIVMRRNNPENCIFNFSML